MSIASHARRLTYLVHRWTGVAGCLLMLLWFVSGIVMLYVGYPKLTPAEHLRALPPLPTVGCCVPVATALSHSDRPGALRSVLLTSLHGQPHYVLQEEGGAYRVLRADTGQPAAAVDDAAAAAQARAFMPGAPVKQQWTVNEDRWTHSRGLDPHRPLRAVQMGGAAPATLYVSSSTGEVVMDAPLSQQRWNYVGAWLHWLYMFRDRPVDPGWSWLVIILSAAGTVSAVTGVCVGLWRWRFSGRYKSGSRSPYRAPWMRWHHIVGLLFAGFVCTWIFSGLMSMNPVGIFDPGGARPSLSAYRGGAPGQTPLPGGPQAAIALLHASGFTPVEMSWRVLGGRPYVLAFDARGDSRLVMEAVSARGDSRPVMAAVSARGESRLARDAVSEGQAIGLPAAGPQARLIVQKTWPVDDVLHAAGRLFPWPIRQQALLEQEDAYYYGRHAEAMNGGADRRLPALRLDFDDPGSTRSYINLRTGDVVLSLSQPARVGRWLFYFLHSWDMPWLLHTGAWRDALLILLSLGGTAISLTGVVIGIVRLRIWLRHATNRRAG